MKRHIIELYRFKLQLQQPVPVGGKIVTYRQGVLFLIVDSQGNMGLGEAAPLPGLHEESLSRVINELHEVKRYLEREGSHLLYAAENWPQRFSTLWKERPFAPTVRWAVESALLVLWFGQNPQILPTLLARHDGSVKLNALLFGTENHIYNQAQYKWQNGYKSLKIKVGRLSIEKDLGLLKKLLSFLPDTVTLRLDANRSWSLDEALCLSELDSRTIEYVEEPVRRKKDIPLFYRQTGLSVALDESLIEDDAIEAGFLPALKALILKPTVLGGWLPTFHWARQAESNGLRCVISDTFSSAIGLQILARLAVTLAPETAHGLDTASLLNEDLLQSFPTVENGRLKLLPISEIMTHIPWERLEKL